MKFDIKTRTLECLEEDLGCCICNEKDWRTWHYCEQDDRIYCYNCASTIQKSCHIQNNKWNEHNDWKIKMVKIIKHNPKHILNKELLENDR